MQLIHSKLQTLSLLIVEDDQSTLKWLEKVFSIYFKKVFSANNAPEALEIFTNNTIDIVISDIQMPHVDGLDFLQKIISLKPKTIRIVMTAFNNPEYLNRAIESEVNFYCKKPIDIDEILVAIASHIPKESFNISKQPLGQNYFYNQNQKTITLNDKIIKLTKKEILLLELFLKNKHSIISINQIQNEVWNEPASQDAIRMVVVGIRKKIYPEFIENIKGLGYKLTQNLI